MPKHFYVTCATCGCDTGASNFTSVQQRLDTNISPVWKQSGCQKAGDCTCHLTPGQLANRTAAGLPTTINFKVRAT